MTKLLSNLSVSNKLLTITIFFCSSLVLVVGYTVITLQQQQADSHVINIAGRQRMLTQKYVKEIFDELEQDQLVSRAKIFASAASTRSS